MKRIKKLKGKEAILQETGNYRGKLREKGKLSVGVLIEVGFVSLSQFMCNPHSSWLTRWPVVCGAGLGDRWRVKAQLGGQAGRQGGKGRGAEMKRDGRVEAGKGKGGRR